MTELEPLYANEGVRLAPPGAPLPVLTHGDVPAEYEAARTGCAMFDRSNLGCLRIAGADAGAFLVRILASDVRGLPSGHAQPSLLLTPKGKVQHVRPRTRGRRPARDHRAGSAHRSPAAALDMYLSSARR
ncbi:MAG: hypothetical protein R3F17_06855 [Planctomycetota bacterium]